MEPNERLYYSTENPRFAEAAKPAFSLPQVKSAGATSGRHGFLTADALPRSFHQGDIVLAFTRDPAGGLRDAVAPALVAGFKWSAAARQTTGLYLLRFYRPDHYPGEACDFYLDNAAAGEVSGLSFPAVLCTGRLQFMPFAEDLSQEGKHNITFCPIGKIKPRLWTEVFEQLRENEANGILRLLYATKNERDDYVVPGIGDAADRSFALPGIKKESCGVRPHLFDEFRAMAETVAPLTKKFSKVLSAVQHEFENGHYAEAESQLVSFVAQQFRCKSPCAAMNWTALGILHERLATAGDVSYRDAARAEAINDYQGVLAHQPANQVAWQGLERLTGAVPAP